MIIKFQRRNYKNKINKKKKRDSARKNFFIQRIEFIK